MDIRAGGLLTFPLVALADRLGRRRLFLAAVAGMCLTSTATALAQTPAQFAGIQVLSRALMMTAFVTGVVMLVYLDEAYHRWVDEGRLQSVSDIRSAVREGAVERLRPKVMTVLAITAGLAPILWSHGTGADVMKRIAAPMVGGMVTSTVLTLVVIPSVYLLWRARQLRSRATGGRP